MVPNATTPPHSRDFATLSLSQKVPLVAAVLILLVGVGISIASYLQVRHTAYVAAVNKVENFLELVGSGRNSTGEQLRIAARRVGSRSAITEYVSSPTPEHRDAALAALNEQAGQQVVASQVIDKSGRVILTTDSTVDPAAGDFPAEIVPGDSGSVGRMRMVKDSLAYPVAVHIAGGATLVQWRRATTGDSAQTRRTQQVLGAVMMIGNDDGSYWTDLNKQIRAPAADVIHAKGPVEYTRDTGQGKRLGAFMPLKGTPWIFAVEIPLDNVDGPALAFLRRILAVTLLCVLLGALAAWRLSRRVTAPLIQLTDAADAVAMGGNTAEIPVARRDEVGRLAASFGVMARQVQDARTRLEEKVEERTAELNTAMQQLRTAQETLVRREKLAMVGQLAGGVGHELRNPLGVMSNAIHYLEAKLDASPADVRESLRLLREQVSLSSKIVADLLDSARITPAHRRPVPLREIVDAQVARINSVPHITVDVDCCEELHANVDPVHIGQAVFNLLNNAIQAIGDNPGEIRITAHAHSDREVAMRIKDSGPGIPPDVIDHIFEPLFTTKSRGIGLGLAVSRAMVQASGGEITVCSEPGRGATFTMTLPLAVATGSQLTASS